MSGGNQRPGMRRSRPIGCRVLVVGGVPIRVRWRDQPPAQATDHDAAVVVLPGWSLGVTSPSCWPLSQAFADRFGTPAIAMEARAEEIVDDSLAQQAEALGRVLLERGLRRIIIAGHSQGGALGTNLAAYLARQSTAPDVEVLALLDPVGLYDQGRTALILAFLVDALVATPAAILRHLAREPGDWPVAPQALRIAVDLVRGIAADVVAAGGLGPYRRRSAAAIADLARANPRLKQVRSLVVLVQGANDRVSDPWRLAAPAGEETGAPSREVRARGITALFSRSPRVHWFIETTFGVHGLPLLRPEAMAAAALLALDRWRRDAAGNAIAVTASAPSVGAN